VSRPGRRGRKPLANEGVLAREAHAVEARGTRAMGAMGAMGESEDLRVSSRVPSNGRRDRRDGETGGLSSSGGGCRSVPADGRVQDSGSSARPSALSSVMAGDGGGSHALAWPAGAYSTAL
jgi:hypothetical protein